MTDRTKEDEVEQLSRAAHLPSGFLSPKITLVEAYYLGLEDGTIKNTESFERFLKAIRNDNLQA